MKLTTSLLAVTPFIAGLVDGFPAEHFTITALGDLVPSGYTGYKYSVRFLIRDKFNAATLTQCGHTWAKQGNYPGNYITCEDPNWRWRYIGQYRECGFSMSLSHSKIESDGINKYNTTTEATLLASQVPCGVGASKNFTCIYGTTGAQLCGLGKGTILQVPVRSIKTKTSKIAKKKPTPAKGKPAAAKATPKGVAVKKIGARDDDELEVELEEEEEGVVETEVLLA